MKIGLVVKIFFFLLIITNCCLNTTQIDGKCTECSATEVLVNGFCYIKIRGCLRYSVGPICIQCQSGYVLNKTTCIRQALFNNNTNLSTIQPVIINTTTTLTFEEIRNKLGQQYGSFASQANDYLKSKYQQLNKSKIRNVQKLQTKKGIFILLEYQLENTGNIIQSICYFNNTNSIKQWSYGPSGTNKNDPFKANIQIRTTLTDKLKDYIIYQITQQPTTITINYINPKYQIIRVIINKSDINNTQIQPSSLLLKLIIKYLSLSDLVQQQISQQYPKITNMKITSTQKIQDYYIIYFGVYATVSYRFNNYSLLVNKLVENFGGFPNIQINQNNGSRIIASFTNFTNYSDQKFTNTIQRITKQLPQIIGAQIVKVQSQTTPLWTNFLTNLKKSIQNTTNFDQYQFKSTYFLNKTTFLLQAKKNTKIIYNINYNYNLDTNFFTYYKNIQNTTNITNIPVISSVVYKNSGAKKYYKIIYSQKQYSEMEYIVQSNKVNVISYTIDGQNILQTLSSLKPLAIKRSQQLLLSFITQKQPNLHSPKLKQLIQNIPYYTLIIVTDSGTYNIIIDDKGGQLQQLQINKISNITCFTMTNQQIQNNSQIISIDGFIKNNYKLEEFNLYLVQVNVLIDSVMYRFLYSNNKLKQVQIYLEQSNDTANIVKASFINYGYYILDQNNINANTNINTNQDYLTITNFIQKSQLQGTKIPFFVQTNDTSIRAYYNDGKSIYQVLYFSSTSNGTISTIYTRNYLLVPQGFNVSTMIYPSATGLAGNDSLLVLRISQEALRKYAILLKDSILVYLDKKSSKNYIAMFKNQYAYMKVQATLDDTNNPSSSSSSTFPSLTQFPTLRKITIGRLTITGYQQSDFTNCTKLSTTGKCLNCDTNSYIEYQGACHLRIQGCLIQAGILCIKCNADYVKSQYKCYKECPAFFK